MRGISRSLLFALILGVVAVPGVMASGQPGMSLGDLIVQSDKIFRGTVFESRAGSVQTATGEIPTITYLIRVDDAFQGKFQEMKGHRVVEITTVGSAKVRLTEDQVAGLPLMPAIEVGKSYLLFTRAPDINGLTGTVGAAQGSFNVLADDGQERVFNRFGKADVFAAGAAEDGASHGRATYSQAADQLRGLLSQQ